MASNGIFSGQSQAPETPGLQELIDSLTAQSSEKFGYTAMSSMYGGISDKLGGKSPQQSMKDSQLEQLARSMLGYDTPQAQQGPFGLGSGSDFAFPGVSMGGQGGFTQQQLDLIRQNAGGATAPGMAGFQGMGQSLLNTQQSALQKSQQTKQSADAAYKLGLQQRGSSGTVTSNITN